MFSVTARKFFFASFLFLYVSVVFAGDVPTKNLGEQAMIVSLRQAMDSNPITKSSKYKFIIGAGESGAKAFKNPSKDNEKYVLLTWQWLDSFKNINKNTIIVAPRHSVDDRFKSLEKNGVRLILISGVLHTKNIEKIQNEPTDKINPSTRYIAMLAGDTHQEDGKLALYDKKMLFGFLEHLPQNQNILILNGPRTGKHIENSNSINSLAHRTETDHITQAVKDKQVQNWQVVDFNYQEKSLWDAALNFCIKHPHVGLILPGESTSMISEALSLGIMPVVYEHKAMSLTSKRYISQLKEEHKVLEYPMGLNMKLYSTSPTGNQLDKILTEIAHLVN